MNLDLDKKIIALCIQYPELLSSSFKDVKPDYFQGYYQKIYKLLKGYYSKHKKVPSFDLFEEKLQKDKTKIFGTDPHADDIIISIRTESVLTQKSDYEFLVNEVKERQSEAILKNAIPQAVEAFKGQDLTKATDILQGAVTAIKGTLTEASIAVTNTHEYVDTLLENYQLTQTNPNQAWGIKTGFAKLDDATFGMKSGELFVIAARHGNGKSVWLLSAAVNAFKDGHNIVLVSLEMPTTQVWQRFIACYAGVPISGITTATLSPEQHDKFLKAIEEIKSKSNRFTIIDAPHVTVDTISAELSAIHEKYKPDLLAIDYLGIVTANDRRLKDHEAQAAVVQEVRQLARTLHIPVISAVQLNREPGKAKKTKGTERLSRSDVIGATADVVLQIEEIDPEEAIARLSNKTKIFCTKNRKGPAPFEMDVCKDFACARFLSWDPSEWTQ